MSFLAIFINLGNAHLRVRSRLYVRIVKFTTLILVVEIALFAIVGIRIREYRRCKNENPVDSRVIELTKLVLLSMVLNVMIWALVILRLLDEHYAIWYDHRFVTPPRAKKTREEIERMIAKAAERKA